MMKTFKEHLSIIQEMALSKEQIDKMKKNPKNYSNVRSEHDYDKRNAETLDRRVATEQLKALKNGQKEFVVDFDKNPVDWHTNLSDGGLINENKIKKLLDRLPHKDQFIVKKIKMRHGRVERIEFKFK